MYGLHNVFEEDLDAMDLIEGFAATPSEALKEIEKKYGFIPNYNWENGTLMIKKRDACIRLTGFPSNCGIIVLHDFFREDRDKVYREFLKFIFDICSLAGYSTVLYSATTTQSCVPTLLEAGFTAINDSENLNKRSGNSIILFQIKI